MAGKSDIEAGRAYVTLYLRDRVFRQQLQDDADEVSRALSKAPRPIVSSSLAEEAIGSISETASAYDDLVSIADPSLQMIYDGTFAIANETERLAGAIRDVIDGYDEASNLQNVNLTIGGGGGGGGGDRHEGLLGTGEIVNTAESAAIAAAGGKIGETMLAGAAAKAAKSKAFKRIGTMVQGFIETEADRVNAALLDRLESAGARALSGAAGAIAPSAASSAASAAASAASGAGAIAPSAAGAIAPSAAGAIAPSAAGGATRAAGGAASAAASAARGAGSAAARAIPVVADIVPNLGSVAPIMAEIVPEATAAAKATTGLAGSMASLGPMALAAAAAAAIAVPVLAAIDSETEGTLSRSGLYPEWLKKIGDGINRFGGIGTILTTQIKLVRSLWDVLMQVGTVLWNSISPILEIVSRSFARQVTIIAFMVKTALIPLRIALFALTAPFKLINLALNTLLLPLRAATAMWGLFTSAIRAIPGTLAVIPGLMQKASAAVVASVRWMAAQAMAAVQAMGSAFVSTLTWMRDTAASAIQGISSGLMMTGKVMAIIGGSMAAAGALIVAPLTKAADQFREYAKKVYDAAYELSTRQKKMSKEDAGVFLYAAEITGRSLETLKRKMGEQADVVLKYQKAQLSLAAAAGVTADQVKKFNATFDNDELRFAAIAAAADRSVDSVKEAYKNYQDEAKAASKKSKELAQFKATKGNMEGADEQKKLQDKVREYNQDAKKAKAAWDDLVRVAIASGMPVSKAMETAKRAVKELKEDVDDARKTWEGWKRAAVASGQVISADDVAAGRALTLAYKELKVAGNGLWIQLGQAVAPALADITKLTTGLVRGTIALVMENKALITTAFKVASGIAMVGTGLATVGGALMSAGAAISPFTVAIASIAGVMTALELKTKAGRGVWETYKGSLVSLYSTAMTTLKPVVAFVSGVVDGIKNAILGADFKLAGTIALSGLKVAWFEGLTWIASKTNATFGAILTSLADGRWMDAGKAALTAIEIMWQQGMQIADDIWGKIVNFAAFSWMRIRSYADIAWNWIAQAADDAWGGIVQVADDAFTKLVSLALQGFEKIEPGLKWLLAQFDYICTRMKLIWDNMSTYLVAGLGKAMPDLVTVLKVPIKAMSLLPGAVGAAADASLKAIEALQSDEETPAQKAAKAKKEKADKKAVDAKRQAIMDAGKGMAKTFISEAGDREHERTQDANGRRRDREAGLDKRRRDNALAAIGDEWQREDQAAARKEARNKRIAELNKTLAQQPGDAADAKAKREAAEAELATLKKQAADAAKKLETENPGGARSTSGSSQVTFSSYAFGAGATGGVQKQQLDELKQVRAEAIKARVAADKRWNEAKAEKASDDAKNAQRYQELIKVSLFDFSMGAP